MSRIDDIIERLGGAEQAARLTGVGVEAVRQWRQSGLIRSQHRAAVSRASGIALASLSGTELPAEAAPAGATAVLVLADGSVIWGVGFGASDEPRVGEVCFSTGLTGYQETLTDPSFAGQIITFTFPHVGNVGTNRADEEADAVAALGVVLRELPTASSSWRASDGLDRWLRRLGVPGIAGVDTRALTLRLRQDGAATGVLSFPVDGRFALPALVVPPPGAAATPYPGNSGNSVSNPAAKTAPPNPFGLQG